MIARTELARLNPAQRAEVIYAEARSDLSNRLWQAALGDSRAADEAQGRTAGMDSPLGALLAALDEQIQGSAAEKSASMPPLAGGDAGAPLEPMAAKGLGPNARYRETLDRAAARSGIPAGALAAIVNAEAAKGPDGSWNIHSRNPRSSAAGLGQFLSGTWESEAERAGTWLNNVARANGWLTDAGQVAASARSALLALRYDAEASINATADYARNNIEYLRRAGVEVRDGATDIARVAYVGHHLGIGDAVKFFRGEIGGARAKQLLDAQIGAAGASERIARSGGATEAHRAWLLEFVERRVRPPSLEG